MPFGRFKECIAIALRRYRMLQKLLGITLVTVGLSLAASAMAADPAAICAGCHGKDGVSTDANIPTIAGLSPDYVKGTLDKYKKKTRPAIEVTIASGDKKGTKSDMYKAIADLSDADIAAVANTYSAMKYVPTKQTVDPALAAQGKDIQDKLCAKCHTEGGSVAEDDCSILAGQPAAYLKTQLLDYKAGKRPVPTKMQPKLDQVQPTELDALVAFYASQSPK